MERTQRTPDRSVYLAWREQRFRRYAMHMDFTLSYQGAIILRQAWPTRCISACSFHYDFPVVEVRESTLVQQRKLVSNFLRFVETSRREVRSIARFERTDNKAQRTSKWLQTTLKLRSNTMHIELHSKTNHKSHMKPAWCARSWFLNLALEPGSWRFLHIKTDRIDTQHIDLSMDRSGSEISTRSNFRVSPTTYRLLRCLVFTFY